MLLGDVLGPVAAGRALDELAARELGAGAGRRRSVLRRSGARRAQHGRTSSPRARRRAYAGDRRCACRRSHSLPAPLMSLLGRRGRGRAGGALTIAVAATLVGRGRHARAPGRHPRRRRPAMRAGRRPTRGAALVLAVLRDGRPAAAQGGAPCAVPDADRGQATVEVVGLWLIIRLVAAVLLLALPRARPLLVARAARRSARAARRVSRPPPAWPSRRWPGAAGRGGTPTLLAAERLLALELGRSGRARLPARAAAGAPGHPVRPRRRRHRSRRRRPVPGDLLVAYPTRPPSLAIAEPDDEPRARTSSRGAAAASRGQRPGTRSPPSSAAGGPGRSRKLLGRAQTGQRDLLVLVARARRRRPGARRARRRRRAVRARRPALDDGRQPAHAARSAPRVHVVVVRAGRVLVDRLVAGDGCRLTRSAGNPRDNAGDERRPGDRGPG